VAPLLRRHTAAFQAERRRFSGGVLSRKLNGALEKYRELQRATDAGAEPFQRKNREENMRLTLFYPLSAT